MVITAIPAEGFSTGEIEESLADFSDFKGSFYPENAGFSRVPESVFSARSLAGIAAIQQSAPIFSLYL